MSGKSGEWLTKEEAEADLKRKVGRPPTLEDVLARARELRAQGLGYGTIARQLGIGKTTVREACANPRHSAAQEKTGP